ncbi:MAG: SHOCT domain-containing protein [Anaerolineae bacterium]
MWFGQGIGWAILGWIALIAFWGGLFMLALFAARAIMDASIRRKQDPLDNLNTRYARGEITVDEYNALKRRLGEHHA